MCFLITAVVEFLVVQTGVIDFLACRGGLEEDHASGLTTLTHAELMLLSKHDTA